MIGVGGSPEIGRFCGTGRRDGLPALGIEGHLPRRVDHAVDLHGLAVGTDGLRRLVGRHHAYPFGLLHQNNPSMVPSGWMLIRSAAGLLPSPGIVMMSPASATTKPAPAAGTMSRTCSVYPLGAPSFEASSEKEYCVLAMHTGVSPSPSLGNSSSARSAAAPN